MITVSSGPILSLYLEAMNRCFRSSFRMDLASLSTSPVPHLCSTSKPFSAPPPPSKAPKSVQRGATSVLHVTLKRTPYGKRRGSMWPFGTTKGSFQVCQSATNPCNHIKTPPPHPPAPHTHGSRKQASKCFSTSLPLCNRRSWRSAWEVCVQVWLKPPMWFV